VKEIIATKSAPAAIGPYSQAVKVGETVYASGQIPLSPETGAIVGADAKAQTRQSMENLTAVLAAAGARLSDVVKATIFITDMAAFPGVNEIYAGYFKDNPPARSCVAVAALPKGALVEIEAVAVVAK